MARFCVFRAENLSYKAHVVKYQKSGGEWIKIYNDACQKFLKAFTIDSRAFNLRRALDAEEACGYAEDQERTRFFKQFAEDYAQIHPIEEAERGGEGGWFVE